MAACAAWIAVHVLRNRQARFLMRSVVCNALTGLDGLALEERPDPGAPGDFKHFCETTGHRLLDSKEADGVYVIRIEAVKAA